MSLQSLDHSTNTTRKLSREEIEGKVNELVASVSSGNKTALLAGMIYTVLGLGEDNAEISDLKLLGKALAEMRRANAVFQPFRHTRKVAVFGSARTKPEEAEFQTALEFAKRIVAEGFMVITGGGDGIMGAAQLGAGADRSFGLNIRLPFEQRPNAIIQGNPKLITFNYFFARKLSFMKETHAFVLLPGGFGTLDEGFESLTLMQTGKTQIAPIILLDKPDGFYWETWRRFIENDLFRKGLISESDFHLFHITRDVQDAINQILNFYRVFHSYRWVRDQLVIRLTAPLVDEDLALLSERFCNLLNTPSIEQTGPLPEEREDENIAHLPRLVLTPSKKDFGYLRLLINHINQSKTKNYSELSKPSYRA
ncbi:MAG: TIGR00730 family Rossman fold protein [Chthoniobacterales bacterium]|nr:TIGR00730 family Rossman fold protein [Chthoniobacterales bacterium]